MTLKKKTFPRSPCKKSFIRNNIVIVAGDNQFALVSDPDLPFLNFLDLTNNRFKGGIHLLLQNNANIQILDNEIQVNNKENGLHLWGGSNAHHVITGNHIEFTGAEPSGSGIRVQKPQSINGKQIMEEMRDSLIASNRINGFTPDVAIFGLVD